MLQGLHSTQALGASPYPCTIQRGKNSGLRAEPPEAGEALWLTLACVLYVTYFLCFNTSNPQASKSQIPARGV